MDPATVIALCSVVIAIAAFFVTIWQLRATQRHNRLSVKPHLDFTYHTSENRVLRTGIELHNNGVGPAFIREAAFYLDGEPIEFPKVWIDELEKKGITNLITNVLQKGSGIGPGQVLSILSLRTAEDALCLEALLDRFNISVIYESAYEERFEETLQPLFPSKEEPS